MKEHSIENRCDIEAENILFAGMSVHFQPGNVTGWGSEGVNAVLLRFTPFYLHTLLPLVRSVVYLSFLIVSFE